jgi:hypothetical protein
VIEKYWSLLSLFSCLLLTFQQGLAHNNLQPRVNYYEKVRNLIGNLTYENQQISLPINFSTRPQIISYIISKGQNLLTMLALETDATIPLPNDRKIAVSVTTL